MTTERYFATATAQQHRDAAGACRFAARAGLDDDWDHTYALNARQMTEALGWSWDFSTWTHAASILEGEARLAEKDEA